MSLGGGSRVGGAAVGAIVLVAILGIVWGALMLWWLIWSILDLVNGNPATFWNIAGIIVPALSLIGSRVSVRRS